MGTPGMRGGFGEAGGSPGSGPNSGCSRVLPSERPELIKRDPTPPICAKLLTIDIFLRGARGYHRHEAAGPTSPWEPLGRGHLGKGAGPSRVRGAECLLVRLPWAVYLAVIPSHGDAE
jgi:hypothetical protein